ncbi:unnamed protein product [Dicrocoelium dendriticum]|nr:unnamed protein product [Dicrocoelium dendriticum]
MDEHGSSETRVDSKPPVCIIVLGMAGSGKTTFVNRLLTFLGSIQKSVYAINLDPAVHHVPYPINIDIRDTVKYKDVMKQYGFGPNGAIMTSLNFFASRFHKVISLINENAAKVSYVVLDTPGQIEVFTWSASGTIISESLGASFPTLVIYVMDTPRSHNPVTFMSNMLYACSVLYRMRLPFIVVLNKTDIIDCSFAIEWMRDFESFQEALAGHRSADCAAELEADGSSAYPGTSQYMMGLVNSMSLVLDEFYSGLRCCGVSSITGEGMEQLLLEVDRATVEYHETYAQWLRNRRKHAAKNDGNPNGEFIGDSNASGSVETGSANVPSLLGHRRFKNTKRMLIDLAGDCDDVDDDPLAELDGTEQRDDTDNEDVEDVIDEQFRRQCNMIAKATEPSPKE